MAFQLNQTDEELGETHEINVTPFIDVILVLLIIFMVAAPLATVNINVDLPASNAKKQPLPQSPIYLTLKKDLSLALGDTSVTRADLNTTLKLLTQGDKQRRIFLRADKHVYYGDLISLMNELRNAKYLKIALVGLENE